MTIQIELNGKKRKALVEAISEHLAMEAVYKGAPSYAYEIGAATVERSGALSMDGLEPEAAVALLEALHGKGFGVGGNEPAPEAKTPTEAPEMADTAEGEPMEQTAVNAEPVVSEPQTDMPKEPAAVDAAPTPRQAIRLPLDGFDPTKLDNLSRLIDSKAGLIRKAMEVTALPVAVDENEVSFPWFKRNLTPEETAAYTDFLTLLAEMAKRQARVIAVEREVENEKYAFRCFLLRIGMNGSQFGDSRRILLKNLVGNGSMKSGTRKAPPMEVTESPMEEEETPEPAEPEKKTGVSLKSVVTGMLAAFKAW